MHINHSVRTVASAQVEAFTLLLFLLWPPQPKLQQLKLTLSACTFVAAAATAAAAGGVESGAPKQEQLPRCVDCISVSPPAETARPMT